MAVTLSPEGYAVELIEECFAIVYEAKDCKNNRLIGVLKSTKPDVMGYRLIQVHDRTTHRVWALVIDSEPFTFTGKQFGIACFIERSPVVRLNRGTWQRAKQYLHHTAAFFVHYLVPPPGKRYRYARRMEIFCEGLYGIQYPYDFHHSTVCCVPLTPKSSLPLSKFNRRTLKRVIDLFVLHLEVGATGSSSRPNEIEPYRDRHQITSREVGNLSSTTSSGPAMYQNRDRQSLSPAHHSHEEEMGSMVEWRDIVTILESEIESATHLLAHARVQSLPAAMDQSLIQRLRALPRSLVYRVPSIGHTDTHTYTKA